MMLSVDEISERLIVGFESFVSLASACLTTTVTGVHLPPLSTPAICHLYGSETPTTEFFLDTSIGPDDDVCVASDWLVLLFQFLVIHAFSWWSRWLVWEPIARRYLGETRATKKRVAKFSQALVQTIFHLLCAWFAWRILSIQPWIYKSDEWSQRQYDENPTVAPDIKFYFLVYAARCLSDTLSLTFEYTRSDTWAHAVHHVVSVALVLGSAMTGFIRLGCVLVFFMDWVDPIMLVGKMFRYMSEGPNDSYQFAANRLFEVFAILFFLTRNVLLTFVVSIIVKSDAPLSLKALSVLLMLLQAYWFVSIIRTAMNQYSKNKGNVDDIRSDSDESYGHEEPHVRIAQRKAKEASRKKKKKHH